MRMRRTMAVRACIWGLLSASSVAAQTSENASSITLHVYTNLVQIPTLVLGDNRKPIARIDERRFFVSIDGGRKLRATHARLEGDDPISLTILMDLSQSNPGIISSADQAIASLAVMLIRARYIVEFLRPMTTVGGHYGLDITMSTRPEAFIRPTGSEFPGDDPAILNDPTTVRSDRVRRNWATKRSLRHIE
jgi:hypothetical protein